MLALADVPALYAGRQIRFMLNASDSIYPRVNAIGTVSNLVLAVMCFLKRNETPIAGVKWPILAGAFLANLGTTVYTFAFMVPRNNGMRNFSKKLEENPDDKMAQRELRRIQDEWKVYAYGECFVWSYDWDTSVFACHHARVPDFVRCLADLYFAGRAALMMSACVLDLYSVWLDGRYIKY